MERLMELPTNGFHPCRVKRAKGPGERVKGEGEGVKVKDEMVKG